MTLIINNNRIIQSKSIGYETIDDSLLSITYSIDYWTRPSDWISVPTPATGSEISYMLVGVYETGPNFLTIQGSSTFSIDWGDGSSQIVGSGSYARKEFVFGSYSSGTLTSEGFRQALVTVTPQTSGTFYSFDLNNNHAYSSSNYRPNVLEIKMSAPNLTSLLLQSSGTTQLDRLRNFEIVGTHSVTNLSYLFNSCEALRKVRINCQGVTNTSYMFNGCLNLREVDISNLSSSTNMSAMFANCYSLNTLPSIDASGCSNMSSMFASCINMEESPNLTTTSNLINTSSMFQNCYNLKRVNLFTTSNVTDMNNMFNNCYLLQTVPLFDTRWVTNFSSMFYGSTGVMQLQSIPELNTASASNMSYMFNNCRYLVSDRRTRGVPFLNTSRVTNMSFMFVNCYRVKTIPQFDTSWVTNFSSMFSGCILLSEVPQLTTASASNMSSMFTNCRVLQTVPLFNTQNVTNFSQMFRYCYQLNEAPNFNMATASDVSYMFDCLTTTDFGSGVLYTVPNFNFSSTIASINMTNFLSGQRELSYIPTFNTSRVTNMAAMFNGCYEIKEVPTLNMSLVTSTNYMFRGCSNLRKVGSLNMPLNTDMRYMFYNCTNLQSIESIFTTSVLTLVREAFRGCVKLRSIPSFNTTGVSTGDNGLYFTFADCQSLITAPGLTTSTVRVFQGTFNNCFSLKTAPSYDTTLATDFGQMFDGCINLENVPVYNIQNVTSLNYVFRNCYNITSVTFSNISLTNNVATYQSFYSCHKLRKLSIPGIRLSQPSSMFENCYSLTDIGTFSAPSVNLGAGGSNGYYRMFVNCYQLTDLSNLTFSTNANEYRDMFSGCNSLTQTPYFSLTSSSDTAYQTNMFTGCYNLQKINATASKYTTSYASCNLNYDNIINVINSQQIASQALTLANRTLNFVENPGVVDMMNFWKRKLVYDKGYTYSTHVSAPFYSWNELRHYVNAGDTYSYTGTGNTFSDISGWTYIPNISPTFSTSTSTADGVLLNSPTFATNNFLFNGTNQAITFGSSSVTLLTNVTIFAIVEPVTLPVGATVSIFGRYGANGEDNYLLDFTDQRLRFGFKQSGSSTRVQRILNKTFNTGQKYFIAARFTNGSNNCVMWVDGVAETSFFSDNITTQNMDNTSTSILSMGGNYAANSSYANIKVYAAGIYNRALSNEQIEELQSFFRRSNIL